MQVWQLIFNLLRTSFLLATKFSKEPAPVPCQSCLVAVTSSTTSFGHNFLPSSFWGLQHQSKESCLTWLLYTYLNIFFKTFRNIQLWLCYTFSHVEELSNQPPCLTALNHFWNIQLNISEVGRADFPGSLIQNLLKPYIPFKYFLPKPSGTSRYGYQRSSTMLRKCPPNLLAPTALIISENIKHANLIKSGVGRTDFPVLCLQT